MNIIPILVKKGIFYTLLLSLIFCSFELNGKYSNRIFRELPGHDKYRSFFNAFHADTSSEKGSILNILPNCKTPDTIYVINRKNLSTDELLLVVSLQGLLVNSDIAIYLITKDADLHWLNLIKSDNFPTEEFFSFEKLMKKVTGQLNLNGYILSPSINQPSINAATCIAGLKRGVLVTEALEPKVQSWGLNKLFDARKLSVNDALDLGENKYASHIVIFQDPGRFQLRDLAIASGAFVFDGDYTRDTLYKKMADALNPGAGRFGWGPPHEKDHIGMASEHDISTLLGKNCFNLSVLSRFSLKNEQMKQSRDIDQDLSYEENVHYVSFILTDGNNLAFLLNGGFLGNTYFRSPVRGDFPMGYQLAPYLSEVAPHAFEYYYNNASSNDEFVIATSGAGYYFPTMFSEQALKNQYNLIESAILKLDMAVLMVKDIASPVSTEYSEIIDSMGSISGLLGGITFPYHRKNTNYGELYRTKPDSTPFLTYRYWLKGEDTDLEDFAEKINMRPTTPYSPEGYSIINVHNWSQNIDNVYKVIQNLDEHVRIVLPSEIFRRIDKFGVGLGDKPPVIISLPEDYVLVSDSDCSALLPDIRDYVEAKDDKSWEYELEIVQSPAPYTSISTGSNKIMISVTDNIGQTVMDSFNIEVIDNMAPAIISTTGDTSLQIDTNCEVTIPDLTPGLEATDNCDSKEELIIAQIPQPGIVASNTLKKVILKVMDRSGNSNQAVVRVQLKDTIKPIVFCPEDKIINLEPGQDLYTVNSAEFDPYSSDDNCDIANISNNINGSSTLKGSLFHPDTTSVVWTVSDMAGNETRCSFKVIITSSVGIEEGSLKNGRITIYPNPIQGEIFIESPDEKLQKIIVSDLTGKSIIINNQINEKTTFDLSKISSGMYIIQILTERKIFTAKIVKK